MAIPLFPPPPLLAHCAAYCTSDPVLGHFLIFFNPQPSTSTSRIEAHILSCAGFLSYPRLTVSPSSPLYAAVNHLPSELQHSDVYRGLAIAVLKYFSELPKIVKETILRSKNNVPPEGEGQAVAFDEMHAGDLVAGLREVESETLVQDLTCAFSQRFLSSLDIDIVVPALEGRDPEAPVPDEIDNVLDLFGDPSHLPFTKLKRSSSKPASAMNRPKSFKDPTEALNRELEELRYTEANYVAKLQDLIETVAKPLRWRCSQRKGDGDFPKAKDLDALFPPCLDKILEVNATFLIGVEKGGVEEVAQCCLQWFPEFRDCYEEYLRASSEFPNILNKLTKDKHSSFSKRVQQTGEQQLRSLIIEPVQRLPRYTLYIDNILTLLPSESPAVKLLNEARDIITEICSLQSSDNDERSITVRRLQTIVISWPPSLKPTGRLVTAVDFYDILPPFNEMSSDAIPSTLLVFPDSLIILRRPKQSSLAARGIMAEVDRPGGVGNLGSGSRREGLGYDLQFAGWIDIADVRVAEGDEGSAVWMTFVKDLKDSWDVRAGVMGVRKLRLMNAYEGRASKMVEDLLKARLERRIASGAKGIIGLRENRTDGLAVWSCVWGNARRYASEKRKGSVVVYLDDGTGRVSKDLAAEVGRYGVDIAVNVGGMSGKRFRVECKSWNDYSSTDTLLEDEFLTAFTRRIASLFRLHSHPQHPPLTVTLMSANRKLMRSLGVPFDGESSRFSRLRPPSPVKLFSSILGNNNNNPPISSGPTSPQKKQNPLDRTPQQVLQPKSSPERAAFILQKRNTVIGLIEQHHSMEDDGDKESHLQKITMAIESPLKKLEETFEAFVTALKMVFSAGADLRPLWDTTDVDEALVEEFRQQMVQNPKMVRVEKDMGIETVFGALDKFLKREWKDGMGSVVGMKNLEELQAKNDALYQADFVDFFRLSILEWAPQNKRAFRTMIFLLREMHNRVETPEEKGVLTKTLAEILVEEGDALDYMSLVDRLVEDADVLFNEGPMALNSDGSLNNTNGTVKRSKSTTGGSAGSSASLRRRFGLTHARENIKSGNGGVDSGRQDSVWRTLSGKASRKENDAAKGHLARSKSIDYDVRINKLEKRPPSRERLVVGPFIDNPSLLLPSPGHNSLQPIVGSPYAPAPEKPLPPGPPEGAIRKRRNSAADLLSDLEAQQAPSRDRVSTPDLYNGSTTSLRTPDRNTASTSPRPTPPIPEEQTPPNCGLERVRTVVVRDRKDLPTRKLIASMAGQPTATPQKLKMQSPQKLRERLHNEKQAITKIEPGLQQEIDRIGTELSIAARSTRDRNNQLEIKELFNQLNQLEFQISKAQDAESRCEALKKESEVAWKKNRREIERLDRLLNDCIAENDVMFEKFNEELVKISSGLKSGKGEMEFLRILQEVKAEQGRLKRENMILRRENTALRAKIEGG
ncbi:hypothetical protein RUND412_010272 [Rhizina undulata]